LQDLPSKPIFTEPSAPKPCIFSNPENPPCLKQPLPCTRLRVGNYRVLFDWDGGVRIVNIEEVRKRDEHTY